MGKGIQPAQSCSSVLDALGNKPKTERSSPRTKAPKRTALVLGAGGTVGIAFHAGVLKAMAEAGATRKKVFTHFNAQIYTGFTYKTDSHFINVSN